MRSVAVVDLGAGNLRSVVRALERAGAHPRTTADPDEVRLADRLVVPGQGAFGDAVGVLAQGLGEAIGELIEGGRPYLGICLGMQVLFESSEESPGARGLGVFGGTVRRFASGRRDPVDGRVLKVPHMGWNRVEAHHPWLPTSSWFYFVHSFYCVPTDPTIVAATASYGEDFCVAVARDRLFACQFHPEKSHHEGQRLLERFLHS